MLIAPGNIDPGRLDRRITLSEFTATRDSVGGVVTSWDDVATVWATKVPQGGGRLYAAEAKHYEQTLLYRIRHRTDVAPGWRLTHGDDVFEITNVEELGRRHFLELSCRAIDQTPGDAAAVGLVTGDGDSLVTGDGEVIAPGT